MQSRDAALKAVHEYVNKATASDDLSVGRRARLSMRPGNSWPHPIRRATLKPHTRSRRFTG